MFCENCGTKIEANEKFCCNCGTPVAVVAPKNTDGNNYNGVPTQGDSSYEGDLRDNTQQPKQPGVDIRVVIGVVAAVVVVAVAVVAFLFINEDRKGNNNSSQPSNQETQQGNAEVDNMQADENTQSVDSNETVVPDNFFDGKDMVVDAADGATLRKGPSADYDEITVVSDGVKVQVKGDSEDEVFWYYVHVNGVYGWMNQNDLAEEESVVIEEPEEITVYSYEEFDEPRKYVVDAYEDWEDYNPKKDGLLVRKGASKDTDKIVLMPEGTVVTALGESLYDDEWLYCKVTIKNSEKKGFVYRKFLDPVD